MAKQRIHGVAIHAGLLEFSTLEQRPDSPAVIRQETAPCPAPTGSRELLADEAEPVLRELASALAGDCAFALPSGRLLTRIVQLPSTDPEELDGMVELQVDQFSPFPVDQLVVSYEPLDAGLGATRTLIAAARRDDVEQVGRLFQHAGLRARWLDIDVMGWWKLIQDHGEVSESGREVLLLLESAETLIILVQDGAPLLFRSLPTDAALSPTAYLDMLIEELDYALMSIETEWGGDLPSGFTVWHGGRPPEGLDERIRQAFDAPVTYRWLEHLPRLSEGIARRAEQRNESMLDLAPRAWEEVAESRRTQRRLIIALGALMLAWLLAVAGLGIAMGHRRSQLADLAEQLHALETPAAEVRTMRQQAQFLDRYTDQTYSALENLRAISTILPAGVDLNSMSYSKGGAVSLRGTAESRSPIFAFLRSMQDLGLYTDVKLGKVDLDRRSGKSVFRLTATLGEETP